jgi:hypothetical protein
MGKFSEDLQELSDRVARMEEALRRADKESEEKLQASIQKAKADAQAKHEAFKAHVRAEQEASAQEWEELQTGYNQKLLEIKNKIDADKEAHEVKKARREADALAADARDLIRFAALAIDDAEVALLEAIYAEAYAESLVDRG